MVRNVVLFPAVALAGVVLASPARAQLPQKRALTLAAAKEIAAAAHAEATRNGWNVVIAILDDGGNLLYLERMDGTQIGSIEVAQRKAYSAVAFRRPTKDFADRLTGGGVGLLGLPGAVPIEGGLPIAVDGQVVGAIGVSGVTSQQDGQIAQAGLAALARGR